MAALEQRMAQHSSRIAALEERLVELSAQLAETRFVLDRFMDGYWRELLALHTQLVEIRRQIADARYMLGDKSARSAGETETALSRLLRSGMPTVEQQAERVVYGRGTVSPVEMWQQAALPPVPPDVRRLYAEIVVERHPGLAQTDSARERNRAIMRRVDLAYARRDRASLEAVAAAQPKPQRSLPVVVDEQAVEQAAVRVQQLERLTHALEGQLFELRYGDVSKLLALAYDAYLNGEDLLGALGQSLRNELKDARHDLAELHRQLWPPEKGTFQPNLKKTLPGDGERDEKRG